MTSSFWNGFEKRALMSDLNNELLLGSAAHLVPLGTTAHTAFAERPEEHSRMGEWGHRLLLGIGGALVGGLMGGALAGGVGGTAGGVLGGLVGERAAHRQAVGRYYNDKGRLKDEK